jgi:hypothetical protein
MKMISKDYYKHYQLTKDYYKQISTKKLENTEEMEKLLDTCNLSKFYHKYIAN